MSRNLYKNAYGNKIRFEEINHDLGLSFTYDWNSSDKYGYVRKSELTNLGADAVRVRFADGLQNLMPYGVETALQQAHQTLLTRTKSVSLRKKVDLACSL